MSDFNLNQFAHSRIESLQVLWTLDFDFDLDCDNCKSQVCPSLCHTPQTNKYFLLLSTNFLLQSYSLKQGRDPHSPFSRQKLWFLILRIYKTHGQRVVCCIVQFLKSAYFKFYANILKHLRNFDHATSNN